MTAATMEPFLQEFVRLGIPQQCDAVDREIKNEMRTREERYKIDLQDLRDRKSQKHPHFLKFSAFAAALEQLDEEYTRECEDIRTNPGRPYFQAWRATDADWRMLAIGLVFERNLSSFGVKDDESRTGDDHWYFETVMANAVKETGGNVSVAAIIAAKHINAQIDAGEFTRQSTQSPKKHVNPGWLRTFYSPRAAARSRLLGGMPLDTLDGLSSWASSTECPIPQQKVAELLPAKEVLARWTKADSLAWARLQAHLDRPVPNTEDEVKLNEFQAERQELAAKAHQSSAWGRLQDHLDRMDSEIVDDGDRRAFRDARQTLIAGFQQYRNAASEAVMDQILDEEALPYHIRRKYHVEECFLAAVQAADSMSVQRNL